jgi:hypothetical protein
MNFIFYNPSKIVGGAEHLFFRLYELYREQGHNCKVVDYANGAFSQLGVPAQDVIAISSIREKFTATCDVFVLPPNMAYEALRNVLMDEGSKVIFWSIHPYNCIPILPFAFYKKLEASSFFKKIIDFVLLRSQVKYARSLFKSASDQNALLFMDRENYSFGQKFIKGQVAKHFLPIPSPVISDIRIQNDIERESLNFFWIGRLVDFKIGALNRVILDLDTWSRRQTVDVILHIVGSGDSEDKILTAEYCKIKKYGYVDNATLHELLATTADAVFSMGTSILESGAIGVPSLIVMPTYETVGAERSYMPLSETVEFDLGAFSATQGVKNFEELVEAGYLESRYGESCKSYVLQNHDLARVAEQLVVLAQNSNFRFKEIKKSYRKFFMSRYIFSVLKRK